MCVYVCFPVWVQDENNVIGPIKPRVSASIFVCIMAVLSPFLYDCICTLEIPRYVCLIVSVSIYVCVNTILRRMRMSWQEEERER